MTDATVLADALVEAGIVDLITGLGPGVYRAKGGGKNVSADQIITDWRVAGKVLESIAAGRTDRELSNMFYSLRMIKDPRAIIEAWYASRESGDE